VRAFGDQIEGCDELVAAHGGRDERRYAYLAGALVALCVYDGGPYPMAFSILLIAAFTACDLAAIGVRRARGLAAPPISEPAGIALVAAAAFILIAAFKLFPVVEFFAAYPRPILEGDDSLGLGQMLAVFLSRPVERFREGYKWVFGEYRDYLGPLVIGGAALTLARGRARARDVVVAAFFLLLMAGDHGRLSPYVLLHHVPGFDSQRVPSRYAILVIPFLGLWFGHALADLAAPGAGRPMWRRPRTLAAALLVGATADLATINATMLRNLFSVPPPAAAAAGVAPRSGFTQMIVDVSASARTTYLRAPIDGHGYVACEGLEPNPIPTALSLRLGALEQVEVDPPDAGGARLTRFTPNRLEVAVDLHRNAMLVVNENFHPGWWSDIGPAVARAGRVAVVLPAGQRTVVLTYRPPRATLYAALTLAGLVGLALALRAPARESTSTRCPSAERAVSTRRTVGRARRWRGADLE